MSLAAPDSAPDDIRAQTTTVPQPELARPVRNRAGVYVGAAIGFTVFGLGILLLAVYFFSVLGAGAPFIGAALALVPLAIVLAGVIWVDRWEPEPRIALIFAFLWGATVSVLTALFVDTGVQTILDARTDDEAVVGFLQAVVQAPIVEEVGKGIAVLLIALVARHLIDGPVDGIVYAAVVAAGFAFTENIQYFGLELSGYYGEDSNVVFVFFIRGIMSPFAHVLFTACAGYAIGKAIRSGSKIVAVVAFLIGLVPAILLHAFWNGSTYFIDFFTVYLLVQVPLFAASIGLVVYLQRQEMMITRDRLSEYAAAGWLSPDEIPHLATFTGRRQAMSWAKQHGIGDEMKRYIRDATQLAYARQRMITGQDLAGNRADEADLLARISVSRRLVAAARPTP